MYIKISVTERGPDMLHPVSLQWKEAKEDTVGEFPEVPSPKSSQPRAADRWIVCVSVTAPATALLAQAYIHNGEVFTN